MSARLVVLVRGALDALEQEKTFPADVAAAREILRGAIVEAENIGRQRDELLAALKGEHRACDWMMARLIERDRNYFPTKSPVWKYIIAGYEAITKAKGGAA